MSSHVKMKAVQIIFADDTAKKTTGIQKSIDSKNQLALNNVTNWLEQNKLTLNIKKQRHSLSDKRKPVKTAFHFTREKENVKSFKFLASF